MKLDDELTKYEEQYFMSIQNDCKIIFDVGVGTHSIFFNKENINF